MLELEKSEINYYQLFKYNKWSSEEISKFKIDIESNIIKPNDLFELLMTIYEYKIPYNEICFNNFQLYKNKIQNFFPIKNGNRDIVELLREHSKILEDKNLPQYYKKKENIIIEKVKKIKELVNYYKGNNIKITKNNIPEKIKSSENDLIALIIKDIEQIKEFTIRDSQIFSLLVLLNKENNRGKITQILTGEGKTIIIILLAIFMVLKGHKVDIVTSNPVLAIRDSIESKKIFSYFGITVDNNVDNDFLSFSDLINSKKEKYLKDVIYGTTFAFQGDILRDEYELTGIRNNRGFDIVIVDEIDSMLIDEYARKTLLSSSKPFYEKYSIYLLILWALYKNTIKKYNIDEEEIKDNANICDKLKIYLNERIRYIIDNNENRNIYIPINSVSKKFALDQVDNWVNSLIESLKMTEGVQYIIKNGEIIPVDNSNTGTIQKRTEFSHGLHQFLQIKNNLPVTPISVTTNYLSNLGYFKRYLKEYDNFIYGMTGTLGSEESRNLLNRIYNLDFDYIPTNNQRILKELTSNISIDHSRYLNNICRIVRRETKGGRSILIICEDINSVTEIYELLKDNFINLRLIKIIGEDKEDQKIAGEMKKNTVIISTNISGRGTDLKLSEEILKNGGLHVIITFMPKNSRIEEQNYGRAGRKGEPGTWQLVLDFKKTIDKYAINYNYDSLFHYYKNYIKNEKFWKNQSKCINYFTIDYLRSLRENRENERMKNAYKHIEQVDKEDKLFSLYCEMINQRNELRKDENIVYLNSIEERWSIFLYNLNSSDKTWNQIEKEFSIFKNKIFNELDNDTVIKNPGFYNLYVDKKNIN